MSVAKTLSEEQVTLIRAWADEGAQLPDLQKRLAAEMNVKVTYMELRFLLDDLSIQIKGPPEPEPPQAPPESEADAGEGDYEDDADDASGAPDSGVRVTISELVRPGMAASGRVTFASGKGAEWWVDRMGRLGLNPDDKEYRPSESEMMEFQRELQSVARRRGY